jgi:hypothetical protein
MRTTPTSSLPGITVAALCDELEKIAKKGSFKKLFKDSLAISAGAGAGTALAMGAEKLLSKKLGPSWAKVSPGTKKVLVVPMAALAGFGAMHAARKMQEAQRE